MHAAETDAAATKSLVQRFLKPFWKHDQLWRSNFDRLHLFIQFSSQGRVATHVEKIVGWYDAKIRSERNWHVSYCTHNKTRSTSLHDNSQRCLDNLQDSFCQEFCVHLGFLFYDFVFSFGLSHPRLICQKHPKTNMEPANHFFQEEFPFFRCHCGTHVKSSGRVINISNFKWYLVLKCYQVVGWGLIAVSLGGVLSSSCCIGSHFLVYSLTVNVSVLAGSFHSLPGVQRWPLLYCPAPLQPSSWSCRVNSLASETGELCSEGQDLAGGKRAKVIGTLDFEGSYCIQKTVGFWSSNLL